MPTRRGAPQDSHFRFSADLWQYNPGKRDYVLKHYDHLRKMIMLEPRGHSGMYGCIIVNPVTDDGDFGVLFTHNEGLSSMCRHGIIGVTKVVLETGMIIPREGKTS